MDSQGRPPLLVLWGWQCCPCRGVDLPWWGEGTGQIKSGLAHRAVQACPWCSAQMVTTHTLEHTQVNTHTSAHTLCFILGGQMWGFECGPSLGCSAFTVYTVYVYIFSQHTHTTCSPQRSNQPSPPPLSFWVFLHHLILAVCMWIIHHSLNQSIEFHLVRRYTGHVIDSVVPFHWSLNDTQCWFVDAHTCGHTHTQTHTHTLLAYTPLHWVSNARGGELGAHAAREDPFETYSRSACPAGCANICSEWPQDWHERGPSTLLDLGSMAIFWKVNVTAITASWRCMKSDHSKQKNLPSDDRYFIAHNQSGLRQFECTLDWVRKTGTNHSKR